MDTRWLKGFKGEAKTKRLAEIKSYQNAFDSLAEVLEGSMVIDSSVNDYESPSWAYKRADQDGYNRAVRQIIKLLNIKDT